MPDLESAQAQYVYAKKVYFEEIPEMGLFIYAKPENKKLKIDKIIFAYNKVIGNFPDDKVSTPLAYIDLANCYYISKQYEKAISTYTKAINKYPDHDFVYATSLFGIGKSYERMKNYDRAKKYFESCIQEFPSPKNEQIKTLVEASQKNLDALNK